LMQLIHIYGPDQPSCGRSRCMLEGRLSGELL